MPNCCITLISYKEKLNENETKSFSKAISVFKNRPIKIILPNNINDTEYKKFNVELVKLDPCNFSNIKAYSKMLCQKWFYELFKDYDYILIYQTDCWVFEDKLDYFMSLNYDYYGAPWPHWRNKVGNGGLSLRKVSKMIDITQNGNGNPRGKNEDMWFCLEHERDLNTPPLDIAVNFSLECGIDNYARQTKDIPMGLHGKFQNVVSLWDENGDKFRKKYRKKLPKNLDF